jgi:hypothetical protein
MKQLTPITPDAVLPAGIVNGVPADPSPLEDAGEKVQFAGRMGSTVGIPTGSPQKAAFGGVLPRLGARQR